MKFFEFTTENESYFRNKVLIYNHNKIPSYALWDPETIEKESLDSRYKWWCISAEEIINNCNNNEILEICKKWKNFLALNINKKKEDILKNLYNNNNVCYTPFFSEEFDCDI